MIQTRLLTAEDVDGLPDDYELYEGVAKGIAAAPMSSAIAVKVIAQIWNHIEEHRCGLVFGANASFRLARDPDTVYVPDASFVRAERIRSRDDLSYPFEGPPDLAVEVLSPWDRIADLDRKMRRYLDAGTLLGWAIDPDARTVTVYRPASPVELLHDTDTLDGRDLLPGLEIVIGRIFRIVPR